MGLRLGRRADRPPQLSGPFNFKKSMVLDGVLGLGGVRHRALFQRSALPSFFLRAPGFMRKQPVLLADGALRDTQMDLFGDHSGRGDF